MKLNSAKLKEKIKESKLTQEEVAQAIGIHKCTFWRKMNAMGTTFSIGEIHRMVEVIHFTREEAIDIFFGDSVA